MLKSNGSGNVSKGLLTDLFIY